MCFVPLWSLISTVACASSSSEISSLLPLRAAWCSGANLHTDTDYVQKHTHPHTQLQKKKITRHNFAEIISRVVQLRPSALCERQEGANDLLPLISNLPTPEPGMHSQCMCVCVCV